MWFSQLTDGLNTLCNHCFSHLSKLSSVCKSPPRMTANLGLIYSGINMGSATVRPFHPIASDRVLSGTSLPERDVRPPTRGGGDHAINRLSALQFSATDGLIKWKDARQTRCIDVLASITNLESSVPEPLGLYWTDSDWADRSSLGVYVTTTSLPPPRPHLRPALPSDLNLDAY